MSLMSTVGTACAAGAIGLATTFGAGAALTADTRADVAVDAKSETAVSLDETFDVTVNAEGHHEIAVAGVATITVAKDGSELELIDVETRQGWSYDVTLEADLIAVTCTNPAGKVAYEVEITVDAEGELDAHVALVNPAKTVVLPDATTTTDASASANADASTSATARSEAAEKSHDAGSDTATKARTQAGVQAEVAATASNSTSKGAADVGVDLNVDVAAASNGHSAATDCVSNTLLSAVKLTGSC